MAEWCGAEIFQPHFHQLRSVCIGAEASHADEPEVQNLEPAPGMLRTHVMIMGGIGGCFFFADKNVAQVLLCPLFFPET